MKAAVGAGCECTNSYTVWEGCGAMLGRVYLVLGDCCRRALILWGCRALRCNKVMVICGTALFNAAGGTQAEGVRELGAEGDIWA
jgi:hypothetical protein